MGSVEVVKQVYAGFAAQDLGAVVATFADDIEWTQAAGYPSAGTYVGAEDIVANVFKPARAEWDGFKVEPETFVGDGDHVVSLGWYSGTYKKTGRSIRARFAHWYTVADGKIVRFEQVADTGKVDEALE